MIPFFIKNEKLIEDLPYEMLEEVTKKILPKNINPNEVPVAFKALLSLAQTNKKMHLLVNSDRIKNHVINVMEKKIKNLPRYMVKIFLRWQLFINGLDQSFFHRVFNEIQRIQNTIHAVLRREGSAFLENNYRRQRMRPINYEAHNFAHHQVGDGMQPKTCLVLSYFNRLIPVIQGGFANIAQDDIEVRYPFGTMKISHLSDVPTAYLIEILEAPFEGVFEKQRRVEGGLVQHIEKGDPEGNKPFELIETKDFKSFYVKAIARVGDHPRKDALRQYDLKIVNAQGVESTKGRAELINTRDPRQFSCYQIKSEVFESMFGRERYDEEMQFCSQLLFHYYRTIPEGTIPSDKDLDHYLGGFLPHLDTTDQTLDYNSSIVL